MAKKHRKAAPEQQRRSYRRHGGVPQLAAQLAGCDLSMVYKVRNNKATSAKVTAAIAEAERQLERAKRRRGVRVKGRAA